MAARDSLEALARCHAVTYRDVRAPGEPADNPLPATGARAAFRLQTGPKPNGRKVEVLLELAGNVTAPTVRVNGILCPAPNTQGAGVFVFPVPEAALVDESHVIEVAAADGKSIIIVRVEFFVGARA